MRSLLAVLLVSFPRLAAAQENQSGIYAGPATLAPVSDDGTPAPSTSFRDHVIVADTGAGLKVTITIASEEKQIGQCTFSAQRQGGSVRVPSGQSCVVSESGISMRLNVAQGSSGFFSGKSMNLLLKLGVLAKVGDSVAMKRFVYQFSGTRAE